MPKFLVSGLFTHPLRQQWGIRAVGRLLAKDQKGKPYAHNSCAFRRIRVYPTTTRQFHPPAITACCCFGVEPRNNWINYMTLSDGKVYWTDSDETPAGSDIGSVWAVSVDGTEEPENLTFIDFPSGIAVDTADEKLYWVAP